MQFSKKHLHGTVCQERAGHYAEPGRHPLRGGGLRGHGRTDQQPPSHRLSPHRGRPYTTERGFGHMCQPERMAFFGQSPREKEKALLHPIPRHNIQHHVNEVSRQGMPG